MRKTLGLLFALLTCIFLYASEDDSEQRRNAQIKVVVLDSISKSPVEFATVSIRYEGSDTPVKYGLTDEKGYVEIEGLKIGNVSVRAEFMGYRAYNKNVELKERVTDLGQFLMQEDAAVLEGVVVTDIANPMTVKKDTIEYNADAFKVSDTDMLEELLKKLPGIEIDSEGTITANGKEIKKIMIDGKEFFLDDPQIATKNLPASIVQKVRVVDKKSEQAEFTGIDDGEEETVIDLNIRPGMMDGWFGNMTGGYGTEDRFQAGGLVAKFSDKTAITLLGSGNNTNNRSFTDLAGGFMSGMRGGSGGGGGSMGGSSGITDSYMVGLNANTTTSNDKLELSGNYMFTGTEKEIEQKTNKETFLNDNSSLFNNEDGYDITETYGHRFGGEIDYKISENTSIQFRPKVNFGSGYFDSYNGFSTLTDMDSTNRGYSSSIGDNNSQNIEGELLLRQKLGKTGRTLSLRLDYDYSNNEIVGYNKSETYFFKEDSTGVINQKYDQKDQSNGFAGRVTYTEPLGNNFFLEAAYRYSHSETTSVKNTWSADSDLEYTILDPEYSSDYRNIFINQQAELTFVKQEEKYNITFGGSMLPATTKSFGRTKDTTYSVLNFAPRARFDYRFSDEKFLRIDYRGSNSQPSINQLLPVSDNSNPLQITVGNDNLNPEFVNRLRTEYRSSNRKNFSWFGLFLDASYTTDKIVSKKYYTPEGVQVSTYENTSTPVYSGSARVMYNSKIAKSNFTVSSFLTTRYNNGVSYVLDPAVNNSDFVESITESVTLTEDLKLTYRNDFIEVIGGGRFSYQNAWYSVGAVENNETWTNAAYGSINATIPGGFNLKTDVRHTFYVGYEDGFGDPTTVWNAELTKSIFKNSATLKFSVYDILNQARNTYRTTTDNYVQDVVNNTLGQYFMFSLVYKFGNFANNKMGNMMGRGKGGMHGGGRR